MAKESYIRDVLVFQVSEGAIAHIYAKIWETHIIVGFLEKCFFKDREWQLNVLSFFYN